MAHWALKGCVERLVQVSRRWVQRAEKNKILWSSKQLAMTAHYPGVAQLPFPIQRLIGQELRKSVTAGVSIGVTGGSMVSRHEWEPYSTNVRQSIQSQL